MGKAFRGALRWLNHISLLHWLYTSLVPAGVAGVVIAFLARMEGESLSMTLVLGLVTVGVVMGISLIIWSGIAERRRQASFRKLRTLKDLDEAQPSKPIQIQPDSAVHEQTVSSPAVEARDTLEATAISFPMGLFVGMIIVSGGRLAEENFLELAIRAFNGTGKPIRVVGLDGAIYSGEGNLRDMLPLPLPSWRTEPQPISPYAEFTIILEQRVTPAIAAEYLRIIEEQYVTLDLRRLNIRLELADDAAYVTRLRLWDAVTIRRRDDIFTGRMTIASASLGGVFRLTATASPPEGTADGDGGGGRGTI